MPGDNILRSFKNEIVNGWHTTTTSSKNTCSIYGLIKPLTHPNTNPQPLPHDLFSKFHNLSSLHLKHDDNARLNSYVITVSVQKKYFPEYCQFESFLISSKWYDQQYKKWVLVTAITMTFLECMNAVWFLSWHIWNILFHYLVHILMNILFIHYIYFINASYYE